MMFPNVTKKLPAPRVYEDETEAREGLLAAQPGCEVVVVTTVDYLALNVRVENARELAFVARRFGGYKILAAVPAPAPARLNWEQVLTRS